VKTLKHPQYTYIKLGTTISLVAFPMTYGIYIHAQE